MKQETLLLRVTIYLIGVAVIAILLALPFITGVALKHYAAHPVYFIAAGLYLSAIPFFLALYHTLRLLGNIEGNKAFSDLSVNALQNIKWCALSVSAIYMLISPFFYLIADAEDAPGILVIVLAAVFAAFVIGVFAAVLQKLLKRAIDYKTDNDLTV